MVGSDFGNGGVVLNGGTETGQTIAACIVQRQDRERFQIRRA